MTIIVIFTSLVLAVTGYMDISVTCARYNVNAYQNDLLEEVDTTYIDDLGSSQIPYIIAYVGNSNEEIAEPAESNLYSYWIEFTYYGEKQIDRNSKTALSYNYSRWRTIAVLKQLNEKYEYEKYYNDGNESIHWDDDGNYITPENGYHYEFVTL
jgi:hypothetical protein